jgi:hypothetical protein
MSNKPVLYSNGIYFNKINDILSDSNNKSCINCINFKFKSDIKILLACEYSRSKLVCKGCNGRRRDGMSLTQYFSNKKFYAREYDCFEPDKNIYYGDDVNANR